MLANFGKIALGETVRISAQEDKLMDYEIKTEKNVHKWGLLATKGYLNAIIRGLQGKGGKSELAITKLTALLELLP